MQESLITDCRALIAEELVDTAVVQDIKVVAAGGADDGRGGITRLNPDSRNQFSGGTTYPFLLLQVSPPPGVGETKVADRMTSYREAMGKLPFDAVIKESSRLRHVKRGVVYNASSPSTYTEYLVLKVSPCSDQLTLDVGLERQS